MNTTTTTEATPVELIYNASGRLIAAAHLRDSLWLICSQWGDEYVVSRYRSRAAEWTTGTYFFGGSACENRVEALADFASRLLDVE